MKRNNQPHMNHETGKKKRHGVITYPDVIGPYTIIKTIGEGAFSIVKLVYHELYAQYYACKIVPNLMLEKRKLYERFELEIRISQLFRHPGVAAITDVLKDDNNFYVFLEYYPNGNLLNYIIKERRLKEDEAKGLMYQIFDALEYIHKQGVCHRDLKPENIIIDNKGHIRISDFGLSQFVGKGNLVKTACGSPCYVSPEVVSGMKYDGFKSDMWSCGVILYAMITGFLPWTKKQIRDIFQQIRNGEYKIPRFVSAQCASLIQMLLTVDPNKRITLEEAKHHTWFNIKSEEDEKNLLSFTIPARYLKNMPKVINGKSTNNQIPYLSTRKVDIYFRPDVDYDFDRQFNDITNLHAICNNVGKDNCDVSSPYLKFENALKILEDTEKAPIRFRRRFNSHKKDNNQNLDLKSASYMRIHSLSTGKLVISKKTFSHKVKDSKMLKEKSETYLENNNDKSSFKINEYKSNTKKAVKILEKRPRKSAGIPKNI